MSVGMRAAVMAFTGRVGVSVREDYDFVDTEDREGAGNVSRKGGSLVVGLRTSFISKV